MSPALGALVAALMTALWTFAAVRVRRARGAWLLVMLFAVFAMGTAWQFVVKASQALGL